MLLKQQKRVEKAQGRVEWAERQLATVRASKEEAVARAKHNLERAQQALQEAEKEGDGRIAWAEGQVRDAHEALEAAETPVAQLVTCLDFLVLAADLRVPCTFQHATQSRYMVHASALASVVSDLVVLGIMRREGDTVAWRDDARQVEIRDFVFLHRRHVTKMPK